MIRLTLALAGLASSAPLPCGSAACESCESSNFLQVEHVLYETKAPAQGVKALQSSSLLTLERMSRWIVGCAYSAIIIGLSSFLCCGLPDKRPQHQSIKDGQMDRSLLILVSVVYGFIYFSTDQYVPSLPQMEADLSGNQSLMSGTVQINIGVKALFGIFAATFSDRVGRKPVLLSGMALLSLATLCCACASSIQWFLAARLLQALGESIEPVAYAVVRDVVRDEERRFAVMAGFQTLGFAALSLAPVLGGFMAEALGWRASFFVLAGTWFCLALLGSQTVESAPDTSESYFADLSAVWQPQLMSLLLVESFIMTTYYSFNTNSSYLTEVTYGEPMMTSSLVMLGFGLMCLLGALLVGTCRSVSVLTTAKWAFSCYALVGLVSIILGHLYPHNLWKGYVAGSWLQALPVITAFISSNSLFLTPLGDCAGLAASLEVLFQSVPPSIMSALATQQMIHSGLKGLIYWQAGSGVAAGVIFWLGYGWNPLETEPLETEPCHSCLVPPQKKEGVET